MGKVLVTGISGFIGSHIALALLRKGYHVRGTLRDMDRGSSVRKILQHYLSAEIPEGYLEFARANLLHQDDWLQAMNGVDFVMHVASPVPLRNPKDEAELITPARNGTLNVLHAALENQVKRVVHTSSTAAIVYGHDKRTSLPFTEKNWTDPDHPSTTAYARSKTLAERAARDFCAGHDLEYVSINPAVVLGPALEADAGTSLEIIRRLLSGKVPAYPNVGFSVVDVRDVAELHIQAMESELAAGARYIAANGFMWLSEIGEILKERYPENTGIPSRLMPDWTVRALAVFISALRPVKAILGDDRQLDSSLARTQLNWQPRPNREAILSAAESLFTLGLV